MGISESMNNQQKQDFVPDAIVSGGESMRNGESLEVQIAFAPERALAAPLITGWPDGNGGTYSTSVLQQLAYGAQSNARVEALLAVQNGLFRQVLDALGSMQNGVQIDIDYARLEAAVDKAVADAMPTEFPEYELTKKEAAK